MPEVWNPPEVRHRLPAILSQSHFHHGSEGSVILQEQGSDGLQTLAEMGGVRLGCSQRVALLR